MGNWLRETGFNLGQRRVKRGGTNRGRHQKRAVGGIEVEKMEIPRKTGFCSATRE